MPRSLSDWTRSSNAAVCRVDRRGGAHGRVSLRASRVRSPWCLRCCGTEDELPTGRAVSGSVSLSPREKKPSKPVRLPGPVSQISPEDGFSRQKGEQPILFLK